VLYYPHYTPSNHHLRSIILFTDQIRLIVPAGDQGGVSSRGHVRPLIEADSKLIRFIDPQYGYRTWDSLSKSDKIIANIIRIASVEMTKANAPILRKDKFGFIEPNQKKSIDHLRSQFGWKYVAVEKIPDELHAAIFDSNCAAKAGTYVNDVTGQVIENNSVICHPLLADFILCRMARQVSISEALPSITFGGANYMDHLFDGEPLLNAPEQELMQTSLDLFVPSNISTLTPKEYLAIRNDYSGLRQTVADYLGAMVRSENLNMKSADAKALARRILDARKKIEDEMEHVARSVGQQRFLHGSALALEAAATLGGVALGQEIAGSIGAFVGAGIGLAGSKTASLLSTVGHGNKGLESVIMTKAKIERSGLRKRWNAPRHWS